MDLDYLPHLFGEAYAEVYPSLTANDPRYPSPETLLERTFLGNYEFEGDTRFETDGSRFIASCLLDDDPRTLYLEAWGGSNTVARALMSIEETYRDTAEWESVYQKVCDKGVLISFGDQGSKHLQRCIPERNGCLAAQHAGDQLYRSCRCTAGRPVQSASLRHR